MKIKKVSYNNRKKNFTVFTAKDVYEYPYSLLRAKPKKENLIVEVYRDKELGNEGFTYTLASGSSHTVHIDQVLEYNQDTEYVRELLLYKLTVKAQKLLESKKTSKREIMRRLKTSPTQFYRLMDQTFYRKTIDQMIKLLAALDCYVDIQFKKAA